MHKPKPLKGKPAISTLWQIAARVLFAVLGKLHTTPVSVFSYTRAYARRTRVMAALALILLVSGLAVQGLLTPAAASATTSSTVNFQARLMSASGQIVPDGSYNVEFKLYNVSSAGSALWTEDYYDSNGVTAGNDNRVTVANGYLTVNLGSQTNFPSNFNWGQQLWLTMNIGGTTQTATPTWDGEMNPRLLLTAVPAAYSLTQYNTTTGKSASLTLQAPTGGDQTFQIQDQGAGGTYNLCIQSSAACGFAAATGGSGYIQNGTSVQTGASFFIQPNSGNIGGVIKANGSGDLLDFQNSSGNVLSKFNSNGDLQIGGANSVASTTAFMVQNTNGGALLTADTSGGRVVIGNTSSAADAVLQFANSGIESAGPSSPTSATNDATVGVSTWTSPTNALASDTVYATNTVNANAASEYLAATGFGFSVPSDATIAGIKAEVERKADASNLLHDNSVKIIKSGAVSGSDKADTGTFWPTTEAYASYGSASDMWGEALTPADVNASNFGVGVSVFNTHASFQRVASVDHIRLTVYFTEPADGGAWTVGSSTATGQYRISVGADLSSPVLSLSSNGSANFSGNVGVNNSSPSAALDINNFSSSQVGLVVRGSVGQSVNLLEVRTNPTSNTLLFSIDSGGAVNATGGITSADQGGGNVTPLTLTSSLSQSVNILTVKRSDNINYLQVASNGSVDIGSGAPSTASLVVRGSTADTTAYSFRLQNSAGTEYLSLRNDGYLTVNTDISLGGGKALRSASSGASLTFATGGGSTGDVTLDTTGATGTSRNILLQPFGGVGIGTTGGPNARLEVDGAASGIGLIVKENATTPGDLLELQDSSGAWIDRFTSSGNFILGNNTTSARLYFGDGSSSSLISIGSAVQANDVTLTIPADTHTTDTICLQTLANCSGGGSGVTTVGTLDGGTANANGASISGSTIYLQSASNTMPGLVNTSTQTFAGIKTFSSKVILTNSTTGLAVTGTPVAGTGITSLVQLGNAITSGNAVANGGTYLGINAPSSGAGSAADFLNFQKNGTSALKVVNSGDIMLGTGLSGSAPQITFNGYATGANREASLKFLDSGQVGIVDTGLNNNVQLKLGMSPHWSNVGYIAAPATNRLQIGEVGDLTGIGLGATLPSYALDVGGTINFTGALRINGAAGSSGNCLTSTGTGAAWSSCGGGSGVTTIGALDGGTANANAATISGSTLYLQSASLTMPGLINTSAQSFFGNKTFVSNTTFGSGNTTVSVQGYLSISGSSTNPALSITSTPAASATASLIQIGSPISGGNAAANGGTYLGLNTPASGAGSAADFLNFQKNNVVKLKLDNSGNLTLGGSINSDALDSSHLTFGAASTAFIQPANNQNLTIQNQNAGTITMNSNLDISINSPEIDLGNSGDTVNINGQWSVFYSPQTEFVGTVTSSATQSLIQVGNAIAGGNAVLDGGTYLGLNAPSTGAGSAADFLNLQANGTSRLKVKNDGSTIIRADSTTGLQVLDNFTGHSLLSVDTFNRNVNTGPLLAQATDDDGWPVITAKNTTIGSAFTSDLFQAQDSSGNALLAINYQGKLTVGRSSSQTGTIIFKNSTNTNTVTLQSAATSSSYTLNLPTAAPSSGQCLQASSSSQLTFGSCGSGANTSLSNLSSTAINTDLIPDTDNTYTLGTSSLRWKDLYLGPGSLHIGSNGDDGTISYDAASQNLLFKVNGQVGLKVSDAGALGVTSGASTATVNVTQDVAPTAGSAFSTINFNSQDTSTTPWSQTYDSTENTLFGSISVDGNIFATGNSPEGVIYHCTAASGCDEQADWSSFVITIPGTSESTNVTQFVYDSANNVIYGRASDARYLVRCAMSTGCDSAADWVQVVYAFSSAAIISIQVDSTHHAIYFVDETRKVYKCDTTTGCDTSAEWVLVYDDGAGFSGSMPIGLTIDSQNGAVYVLYQNKNMNYCLISTGCDATGDWSVLNFTTLTGSPDTGFNYDSTTKALYAFDSSNYLRCSVLTDCTSVSNWVNVSGLPFVGPNNKIVVNTPSYMYVPSGAKVYKCTLSSNCDAAADWSLEYDTLQTVVANLSVDNDGQTLVALTSTNGLVFKKGSSFVPTTTTYANIQGVAVSSADMSETGALIFNTMNSGTLSEGMRLQAGKLGLGNINPTYKLDVADNQASSYVMRIQNTNTANTADGLLIDLGVVNTSRGTGNYFIGFSGGGTVAGKIQGGASAVAYTTSAADYAEYFRADEADMPQPGELVMLNADDGQSVSRTGAQGDFIAGVVSSNPGFVGNAPICKVDDNNCDSDYSKYNVLVSMVGQVPVKVSMEGGAIKPGDAIGASDAAGIGMKVEGPGTPIIGYAMAAATEDGTIKVLVRPGYYMPSARRIVQGGQKMVNALTINGAIVADSINVGGMANIGALDVAGDANIGGNLTVEDGLTVHGLAKLAELMVSGHLLSQANTPQAVIGTAAGQDGSVTLDGTDTAGTITVTVKANQPTDNGTQSNQVAEVLAPGNLAAITFAQNYQLPPRIVISPDNEDSVDIPVYVVKTEDGFRLVVKNPPADGKTYQFDYIVLGSDGLQAADAE